MKIPRVALFVETSNAYARGLLAGVAEYVQDHGPWSVLLPESGRADAPAARLRSWKGDGAIVRVENPRAARATRACRCPVVNLSAAGFLPGVPSVHSDVRAEARMGFDHLWDRGYRNLGFCGVKEYEWSTWQCEELTALARAKGVTVSTHIESLNLKRPRSWTVERQSLVRWLRSLPRPVGIFACYDLRGQQVLDACRVAGLRVPDQVAVIGVDNDPVRCSLSDPPLSSVAPDTERAGYLAAEMLDKLMKGQSVKPGLHVLSPLGVIARRSTDALAIADPDIAAALRYIREHCCEPIDVKQLLQHIPLSRRAFEGRFSKLLGRTPYAEILRCRVDRARQLLHDTDLPIKTIATRVGAGSPEYLSVLFKRSTGVTPTEFRESGRKKSR